MRARWLLPIYMCILFVLFSSCSTVVPTTKSTPIPTHTISPTQTQHPILSPTNTLTPTPVGGILNGIVAYQTQYKGHVYISSFGYDNSINSTEGINGYKEIIGLSPDGRWLAISASKNNRVSNISKEHEIWVINTLTGEQSYLINTDPKALFWSTFDNSVYIPDYADEFSDSKIYKYDLFNKKMILIKENALLHAFSAKAGLYYFEFSEMEKDHDGSGIDSLDLDGNKIVLWDSDLSCSDYMNLGNFAPVDSECFYSIGFCNRNEKTFIYKTCAEKQGLVQRNIKELEFFLANNFVSISPNGKWAVATNRDDSGLFSFIVVAMGEDNTFKIGESLEYSMEIFDSYFLPNTPLWSSDGTILLFAEKSKENMNQNFYLYDVSKGEKVETQLLSWLFDNYDIWDWDFVSPISD